MLHNFPCARFHILTWNISSFPKEQKEKKTWNISSGNESKELAAKWQISIGGGKKTGEYPKTVLLLFVREVKERDKNEN